MIPQAGGDPKTRRRDGADAFGSTKDACAPGTVSVYAWTGVGVRMDILDAGAL